MSQSKEYKPPAGPKVSPVRTIVSLLLLLVVGVVCAIELRAGLGQYLTNKAFAAKSKDGEFDAVKLSDAKAMVSMFPKETVVNETESGRTIKYEWFSLLRPLMSQSSPQMYVIADGGADPNALAYHTEAEDEETVAPNATGGGGPLPPGMGGTGTAGPGGMGMPPGGMGMPPGEMGPGGGRGPGGERGEGGKDRPEMEEEPPATEPPATETPATEPPATEPPATEPPATEPPATEPGGVPPQ